MNEKHAPTGILRCEVCGNVNRMKMTWIDGLYYCDYCGYYVPEVKR